MWWEVEGRLSVGFWNLAGRKLKARVALWEFEDWNYDTLRGIETPPPGDLMMVWYFPGGSDDKASVCNEGDPSSIPGLGRSPGEGNGNPLQYYCLENPMDSSLPGSSVHGVAKSWTRLSDFTVTFFGGAGLNSYSVDWIDGSLRFVCAGEYGEADSPFILFSRPLSWPYNLMGAWF